MVSDPGTFSLPGGLCVCLVLMFLPPKCSVSRATSWAASAQRSSSSARLGVSWIALVRVLGKAAEDDTFQVSGISERSCDGGVTESRTCAIMTSIALVPAERGAAGQHEIGDGAQAVDVGATIGFSGVHDLFRGHVQRRAGDGPFPGEVGSFLVLTKCLHETEIQELGDVVPAAAIGCHDVGRLDVAVHEPDFVCLLKGVAGLAQQIDHPCRRHRAVSLDQLGQLSPGRYSMT